MTAIGDVRDAICGVVKAAWDAGAATTGKPLVWDDRQGDKPGHDADGKPVAYGRVTVRHLTSSSETFAGEGEGKEQHEGIVVVQVFAPAGDGREAADPMADVVRHAFQRKRIPGVDGWFYEAAAVEVPGQGPWSQTNVSARFRWSERA